MVGATAVAAASAAAAAAPEGSAAAGDAVSLLLQEAEAVAASDRKKAAELTQRALQLAFEAACGTGALTNGAAAAAKQQQQAAAEPTGPLPPKEEALRLYEQGLSWLASLYAQDGDADAVRSLLRSSLSFFKLLPKAKTAKLVRILVDTVASIPTAQAALVDVCKECIEWCVREKRAFLRNRIELRLSQLYVGAGKITEGQQLLSRLLYEVKKLDDKLLLVEVHLLDAELHFLVKNVPKSRAALTAARTNANAIHCPPTLQGQLDLQAGILHAHDRDFKTAFSYFFEAFEAFSAQEAAQATQRKHAAATGAPPSGRDDHALALQALKYMLLSKILMGRPDDVPVLLSGKQGLRYYQHADARAAATAATAVAAATATATKPEDQMREAAVDLATPSAGALATSPLALRDLDALRLLALSHKQRSLKMFGEVLQSHARELQGDPVLQHHIGELYESLLEQNLMKILQAYSRVELAHVAKLIDLPEAKVEAKLCEMMLDGKLQGTLDQGVGVLVLFDKNETPQLYSDVLGTIANMADVVDALYEKAQQTL
ncbi:hypothetical protein Esti_002702 [Eimeria stiedai]